MSFIKLKSMGTSPSLLSPAAPAASDLRGSRDPQKFVEVITADYEVKGAAPSQVLRRAKGSQLALSLPPALSLAPRMSRTIRYQNTSASVESVTVATCAGTIGSIGISAVATQPICSSLRVSQIKIWPAAGGACSVAWALESTGFVKDEVTDHSIPTGITTSGGSVFRPPPLSLASFWRNRTNTDTLFTIESSVGSIVDVTFEFTLPAGFADFASQVVASAVIGNFYYLALDGPTTNKYVPVVLPTTF